MAGQGITQPCKVGSFHQRQEQVHRKSGATCLPRYVEIRGPRQQGQFIRPAREAYVESKRCSPHKPTEPGFLPVPWACPSSPYLVIWTISIPSGLQLLR